jgi:preprotein translocase subunit SecG
MELFLQVCHVLVCVVLVIAVLIQQGKGAEIGAVFGGGGSNTVFGSRGAGNFLTKITTGAAITFMLTSLALSYLANTQANRSIFGEEVKSETTGFEEVGEPAELAPESDSLEGGFEEVPSTRTSAAPSGEGTEGTRRTVEESKAEE